MISSLSDNSTETFWESGDEDRNKAKWISMSLPDGGLQRGHAAVHIDNCRDLVSKVSSVTFKIGSREEDLIIIKVVDVENRFAGWVSVYFEDSMVHSPKISLIKIEFKGPDSTLRIRQIKLLSPKISESSNEEPLYDKDVDSLIKQSNCEAETLRVFRLMTAQVFGKLLRQESSSLEESESESEENSDLREHVVGILFNSKTRLSPSFEEPGLLDIFLSCIAKALTVQVKSKGGKEGRSIGVLNLASSLHPRDPANIGSRWWLRGSMAKRISEEIVVLLKDLSAGRMGFSSEWSALTKSAIAQNILNLTKLDRNNEVLKLPIFWLGLAAICVLDKDHVLALSSGENSNGCEASRPTCENHDDGETLAMIKCETCGNLCGDCDRFLHLHRRTKAHARAIFKEEEDAIKVDLHEGCGRMKLYWLLALADSLTLKAIVEFREAAASSSKSSNNNNFGSCRFCGVQSSAEVPVLDSVCTDSECVSHSSNACVKTLPCGHFCGGILNEETCLPCLHGCSKNHSLKQDADDMCMPHSIHTPTLRTRIPLSLLPGCALKAVEWTPYILRLQELPTMQGTNQPSISEQSTDVQRKALMRLEYEGLNVCEALNQKGSRYYKDPISLALDRYAYYVCFKCGKAYFGGEAHCEGALGDEDKFNPRNSFGSNVSQARERLSGVQMSLLLLRGRLLLLWNHALLQCCHDDFQRLISLPQKDLPHCPLKGEECPLHVRHPPTGEEFASVAGSVGTLILFR
ncbi:Putative E3 ubiquitinprotein ligase MYCBP2like [Caligus rogercresseyi]|uniref:E3 ubiquitinprotein ligase MYCBP2like n=1 Tax=Caligus rogercresseyi TaxID=217165 RepID=A0A7T8GVB0_CALRO|nr:Putative E3 ubiquitinprotein ligase MYCBP2like [Caligus rogercresseyi]